MKKITKILLSILILTVLIVCCSSKVNKEEKDECAEFKHAGKATLCGRYEVVDIYTLPNSLDYDKPVISITLVLLYDTTFTKHYFIGHKLPKEMKVGTLIVFDSTFTPNQKILFCD